MIVVTRLNDSRFAVNPDLIERIHETPDTTLIMVDGAKYIVTEPMSEVIEMIARYRARIVSIAYDEPHATSPSAQPLGTRTGTGPQRGLVRGSGGAGRVSDLRPTSVEPTPASATPAAPAATATAAPTAATPADAGR
jgi:flagellar protein FlbD